MKRAQLLSGDMTGSVMSWGVEYSISRNERTKVWTFYARFTDPDCLSTRTWHPRSAAGFIGVCQEAHLDPLALCRCLEEGGEPGLSALSQELKALLS